MNLKFIYTIVLILFISNHAVHSAQVLLNADGCTTIACGFKALLGQAQLPQSIDDVIVYTSNAALHPIVLLQDSLNIKSLNISNGVLKIATGIAVSVTDTLFVNALATLDLESDKLLTVNSGITINGNLVLNGNGIQCNGPAVVNGNLTILSGSFEVSKLTIAATATIPNIIGGTIKVNADSSINVALNILGTATLNINSGKFTCNKGLVLAATSGLTIGNGASLSLLGTVASTFNNAITLGSNALLEVGSVVNSLKVITTVPNSAINIIANGVLNISGKNYIVAPISLSTITSKLVAKQCDCTFNQLNTLANSIISIQNASTFRTLSDITLNSIVNVDTDSIISIELGTLTLVGPVKSVAGSVINVVKGTCEIPSKVVQVINSNVNVAKDAILKVAGTVSLIGNVNCPDSSIVQLVNGILGIGGSQSVIDTVIDLSGTSQLKIIKNSICTIKKINHIDATALISVDTGSILTINIGSVFLSPITLTGSASLNVNGDASIKGIYVVPIDNTPLPSLKLFNCNSKFTGEIQRLLMSLTNTSLNIDVNVKVGALNLTADANSPIVANAGSNVDISGTLSKIQKQIQCIGCLLHIGSGTTQFLDGIITSVDSTFTTLNSTLQIGGKSILNSLTTFDGLGSVGINGDVQINGGVKCSTLSPIDINAKSTVFIGKESVIGANVNLNADATLNILPSSNCAFNGGLNTGVNAILYVNKTGNCLIAGSSEVKGAVYLNGATIVSAGTCNFYNGIKQANANATQAINNLLVNSGTCTLKDESEFSGEVAIKAAANLVLGAPVLCSKGIQNSGNLIINAAIESEDVISQTVADAVCTLNQGSQIKTKAINFVAGKLSGVGKIIASAPCVVGGIIDGAIDITGDLNLLSTAILQVDVKGLANFNKLSVSGKASLTGLIDVSLDASVAANLKVGDTMTIMECGTCEGAPKLSESTGSKCFTLSSSNTTQNLVYQSPPPVEKNAESSSHDTSSASMTSFSSFTLLISSLLLFVIVF
ncbi:hypothetical protein CYY_008870 [Polysphondylium violaceum]|uniref:Uncharacterized protein n=1 Tax=Polysphondylium violaceum TaxID=133409 RepID=A0A8J4UWL0_9MYCE|nr:hypothetical protein CYY_008870 [Polysphondylium violaceum]